MGKNGMLYFDNDYMEGAHPAILERLETCNLVKTPGYGGDVWCDSAREKIRQACGCPEAAVHFLVGGTQTNATVIAALLRPYQGVVAAESGHINVHEAGAIEAGGHKVLAMAQREGKLSAETVASYLDSFYRDGSHPHMVMPGMVCLSHPTEYGTLYTKRELEEMRSVCRRYGLFLYLDGARLGYGLAVPGTDVTLEGLAACCDVFSIGGTKVGALFGEAVVIPQPDLIPGFFTMIKRQGALLAKGWLLGLQFDTLFTDGLYLRLGAHAVRMARRLKGILERAGFGFWMISETNQQFVILENGRMERLREKVGFGFWQEVDERHTAVRFVTSWATSEEQLAELERILEETG